MHECSKYGEIQSVKNQTENLFGRMSAMEQGHAALMSEIIGVNGNYGIRREIQEMREEMMRREEAIVMTLDRMQNNQNEMLEKINQDRGEMLRWIVGLGVGMPAMFGAVIAITNVLLGGVM